MIGYYSDLHPHSHLPQNTFYVSKGILELGRIVDSSPHQCHVVVVAAAADCDAAWMRVGKDWMLGGRILVFFGIVVDFEMKKKMIVCS